MRRSCWLRGLGTAVLCAVALAACGSNRSTTVTTKGAKPPHHDDYALTIYSSLPEQGPERAISEAIMTGIRVARWQNGGTHVGSYSVKYVPLNDARNGTWNAARTIANAHRAAADPHTVAYIGDLDSGATELSLPILNQAGIVQITPGSGYPGLTKSTPPVTQAGEPTKFYPNRSSHTLLRLIPSDLVEAAAALEKLNQEHCVHVAAASFGGGVDGPALVRAIAQTAKLYNMVYVGPPKAGEPGRNTKLYPAYAAYLHDQQVGCFVLAGQVTPQAVALTNAIHTELSVGYIVGTDGFCNRAWLGHGANAIPPAAEPYLLCTSPVRPLDSYPGAKAFIGEFRELYGRYAKLPGPYAVYGYQAAEMVMDVMRGLERNEDTRKEVLEALVGGSLSSVVAGSFSFDRSGDITSRGYGLYGFNDGKLTWMNMLYPPSVLSPAAVTG